MKKIFAGLLLATFCLCATPLLRADVTLVQKSDGMGQVGETTVKIKGNKTRVDASPATSILLNSTSGEMVSLMHGQRKFVKIPSDVAAAAIATVAKAQGDKNPVAPALVPTGKKETISGFAAQEYTTTIAGVKVTLWLTKDVPNYAQILKEMSAAFSKGPLAAMMQNMGMDFSTMPGFPVRSITEVQPGQTVTSTVISVNTNPIPDADFTTPTDYTEMKLPVLTPPGAAGAPPVSK